MVLKQLFFSKNYEKSPSSSGLHSQTPINHTFELQYTSLLNTSPNLNILTIGLSLSLKQVISYVPTSRHSFSSSILRYFCPYKNSFFEVSDDVIACDLPPLPQAKILATPMCSHEFWFKWSIFAQLYYTHWSNTPCKIGLSSQYFQRGLIAHLSQF